MKFGVREICDVVLKAKSPIKIGNHWFQQGEPVCYFDTIKTSSMESGATTVYAQGGGGNTKLLAWEGEKTLTFNMEDALISPKGLAILSGADLIQANAKDEDTFVKAHTTEQIEVKEDGIVNLKGIPVIDESCPIYLMLLDVNGEMSGVPVKIEAVSVEPGDGQVATKINSELVKTNDIVMVDYYIEHKSDAVQIDITPDKFGGYYYLEASTLFRRQADGKDLPAEFIVPKIKVQSNFTFSMASSGDPSSFNFVMDAFPDYTVGNRTKKVLAAIQVLEADDNYDGAVTEQGAEDRVYDRYQYDKDKKAYLSDSPITHDDINTTEEIHVIGNIKLNLEKLYAKKGSLSLEEKKETQSLLADYDGLKPEGKSKFTEEEVRKIEELRQVVSPGK